jgi:hypothetical protein
LLATRCSDRFEPRGRDVVEETLRVRAFLQGLAVQLENSRSLESTKRRRLRHGLDWRRTFELGRDCLERRQRFSHSSS